MIAFLSLFLHVLISPFKTQARLEAEIVLLRHQLNVLCRRLPSKPKLAVVDRMLFVRKFSGSLADSQSFEPDVAI